MAGLTLADAEAQLAAWQQASLDIARNQSYSIEDRALQRAKADEALRMINHWQKMVEQLSRDTGTATPGRRTRTAAVR